MLLLKWYTFAGLKTDVKIKWSQRSYDHNSTINFIGRKFSPNRDNKSTTIVSLSYVKPLRQSISQEAPFVDGDTFISYCGGGLGLFLGFSLVDTLLFISDYILNQLT